MIYFSPSSSGLHSMLGQAMWFKRLLAGFSLEFTLVIDNIVESKRNRGFDVAFLESIQVSEKCIHSKDLIGDIPMLSLTGFKSLLATIIRNPKNLRVCAAKTLTDIIVTTEGWSDNFWHDQHIQLEMAEEGFLSACFPFYFASLQDYFRLKNNISPSTHSRPIMLLHLRLGDSFAISKKDLPEKYLTFFEKDLFCDKGHLSELEFEMYSRGFFLKRPRHFAERIGRYVDQDQYLKILRAIPARHQYQKILITDGFNRLLERMMVGAPESDIQDAGRLLAKKYLGKLESECNEIICGESYESALSSVRAISEATMLITGPSLFVPALLCALGGPSSLNSWIMLDEQRSIDRLFQLPCLVNQDFEEYIGSLKFKYTISSCS